MRVWKQQQTNNNWNQGSELARIRWRLDSKWDRKKPPRIQNYKIKQLVRGEWVSKGEWSGRRSRRRETGRETDCCRPVMVSNVPQPQRAHVKGGGLATLSQGGRPDTCSDGTSGQSRSPIGEGWGLGDKEMEVMSPHNPFWNFSCEGRRADGSWAWGYSNKMLFFSLFLRWGRDLCMSKCWWKGPSIEGSWGPGREGGCIIRADDRVRGVGVRTVQPWAHAKYVNIVVLFNVHI